MASIRIVALVAIAVVAAAVSSAAGQSSTTIVTVDLAKSFVAHSPWRLVATQGPRVEGVLGDIEPGEVKLCLRKSSTAACDPALQTPIYPGVLDGTYVLPHFLKRVGTVHGVVQTASIPGANGNQIILTQVLSYRGDQDEFVRVYDHLTGKNNNQEVRFVRRATRM